MVFNKRIYLKNIRRLYELARKDPVDEDLRGWNWDKPPVKPRAYLGLTVSEIASKYCPTRRDLWLKRVVKTQGEPTEQMTIGRTVHRIFHRVFNEVRKIAVDNTPGWKIYEELASRAREDTGLEEEWAIDLYKTLLLTIAAEIDFNQSITGYGYTSWFPWLTEFHVDGSLLGLSNSLSIDALTEGGVVVEIKYGKPMEFHKLAPTGYAMALEANLEIPFDYGLIIYVNGIPDKRPKITLKPVYISNTLRRWFLDERDNIIDMLLSNEEPPAEPNCNIQCPYKKVCMK